MKPIAEREYFEESLLENDFLQTVTSLDQARKWVDLVVADREDSQSSCEPVRKSGRAWQSFPPTELAFKTSNGS